MCRSNYQIQNIGEFFHDRRQGVEDILDAFVSIQKPECEEDRPLGQSEILFRADRFLIRNRRNTMRDDFDLGRRDTIVVDQDFFGQIGHDDDFFRGSRDSLNCDME